MVELIARRPYLQRAQQGLALPLLVLTLDQLRHLRFSRRPVCVFRLCGRAPDRRRGPQADRFLLGTLLLGNEHELRLRLAIEGRTVARKPDACGVIVL